MALFSRFPALAGLLLGAGGLLSSPPTAAQTALPAASTAVHGYDFLTMTTSEGTKAFSCILFAPAFQGKTEIPLVTIGTLSSDKYKELILENMQRINSQLSALTEAGWELVQVYTPTYLANARCYLFRKAKN